MNVLNVHERVLPGPLSRASDLVDRLSSRGECLWPATRWPPMRLSGPLAAGSAGGHGPIRYAVESYDPGTSVAFRFVAPTPFVGGHRFELTNTPDGGIKLRHTVDMQAEGRAALSWRLVIGPLHDALMEDALDNAELYMGRTPKPRRWSAWVMLLRRVLGGRSKREGAAGSA